MAHTDAIKITLPCNDITLNTAVDCSRSHRGVTKKIIVPAMYLNTTHTSINYHERTIPRMDHSYDVEINECYKLHEFYH
jgi:hypothetical protein